MKAESLADTEFECHTKPWLSCLFLQLHIFFLTRFTIYLSRWRTSLTTTQTMEVTWFIPGCLV